MRNETKPEVHKMLTRNRIVGLKHIVSQCISMTMKNENEIENEKRQQQQKPRPQNAEKLMLDKINVLDQENRRLMAAQHRLVVETNKRTDLYQTSLMHLNMELANSRRRSSDLQLAYVGLLDKNKFLNQILQNQSNCMTLARAPDTESQPKLASSNKIFTCYLNNMSDESTKSNNCSKQICTENQKGQAHQVENTSLETDILTYVKTLENRIRKLERDRNSSHYTADDQNLSSLSPPTSTSMVDDVSGFFGDDDPFLNEKESTVRTADNKTTSMIDDTTIESYNGSQSLENNGITVEILQSANDDNSYYENNFAIPDSTLSPILEENDDTQ